MNSKSLFVILFIMSSIASNSQNIGFSPQNQFASQNDQLPPLIFENVQTQMPATILTLSKMSVNITAEDITNNPFQYDWAKMAQRLDGYRWINFDYRRQDSNGRDLPQDVITKEMIDELLRRN